ncbi:EamA family transporter RarD [Endozoicomonas sp. OPT23]|uniref:EamA family transporter RarD n=1 Tax=Endozoicomonas sp. OPT23 TaxID=2072845 RepID=UPI00129A379A|nr:EamA family transporter RarD [Endozoicomonas sp. OPT23]MRI32646.1 EamA family transporter RarD [Endozoicomonas sp. OPT23]
MPGNNISAVGLLCSVLASVLFGIAPWYVQQLGMDSYAVFWNRMVYTAVVLAAVVMICGQWQKFISVFRCRRMTVLMLVASLLAGVQWWLFVWAPLNGQTKELSLGYFLLPLTLALTGRLVYREKIRSLQQLAILLALVGVFVEIWTQGSLSWVTLSVAGLYPFYFIVRKKANPPALVGNLFEALLYFPIGISVLFFEGSNSLAFTAASWLLLVGMGGLFASSMLFYLVACSRLPVTLFGLMGYLEPALLFLVAVIIFHEPFSVDQYSSYGLIGIAVILTCFDSVRMMLGHRKTVCT